MNELEEWLKVLITILAILGIGTLVCVCIAVPVIGIILGFAAGLFGLGKLSKGETK